MNKEDKKYFSFFGYSYFGPIIYEFSLWLKNELERQKITKVFFLSRDGLILKNAFDIINDSNIKTEYFYASRRALIVPSLYKEKNPNVIFDKIKFDNKITLKSFIKKIGLNYKDVMEYIKRYNFNIDNNYDLKYLKENNEFQNFLQDIFPLVIKNAKEEYGCLKEYVKEKDFNGKIAIVDIGWYGTMQLALNSLFPDLNIYGYYLGLNPKSKIYNEKYYKGFLFDKNNNSEYYDIFYNFLLSFEFLTLARHGSLEKYDKSKTHTKFYEYEYKNVKEEKISEIIQESCLKYVSNSYKEKIKNNKEEIIDKFLKVFLYPSIKDANYFGNIRFVDNEMKYIAKPKSFWYYVFHIKIFINDFVNSAWKVGFMKKLFKIPFPYYKIITKSRKKWEEKYE